MDESLCATCMQSERLVGAEAEHGDICVVRKNTPLYDQILQGVLESMDFARRLSAATSLTGKENHTVLESRRCLRW